jgi:hypothetical protein
VRCNVGGDTPRLVHRHGLRAGVLRTVFPVDVGNRLSGGVIHAPAARRAGYSPRWGEGEGQLGLNEARPALSLPNVRQVYPDVPLAGGRGLLTALDATAPRDRREDGGDANDREEIVTPMRPASVLHINAQGFRRVTQMRWGWSKPGPTGKYEQPDYIHARAETIDVRPTFLDAFLHRRGIVVVRTFIHQSGIKTTFLLYQTAGGAMTAG